MNIDDYRAMKAAQEAEANQPKVEETPKQEEVEEVEETKSTPPETQEETKTTETTQVLPEEIEIEGIGKVTLKELTNGYLRQSDYTRKTQELSRKRKEVEDAVTLFEYLKAHPEVAQKILEANNGELPEELNPSVAEIKRLQNQLTDLKLEREIEKLQAKYEDFEVREVLTMARDKRIPIENLEDAYFLVKSQKQKSTPSQSFDVDALKKQLREELLRELSAVDTSSIIQSKDSTTRVESDEPKLSAMEIKVARNMGMSPEEYAKWRDNPKRK